MALSMVVVRVAATGVATARASRRSVAAPA